MKFGGEVIVPAGNLHIVEGSYRRHPRFGDYAALRAFFDLSPEEQAMRILKRNGEEMAQMFRDRQRSRWRKHISTPSPFGNTPISLSAEIPRKTS